MNGTKNMGENGERRLDFTARNLSFVVLLLAIVVSGYLSYLKLSHEAAICIESGPFDCGVVLNSVYSEMGGIPIAWLGLGTNLIVITLLLLEPHVDFLRQYGTSLIFGVVLFAFLYSVYLVYVQAFRLLTFCPWCLTHEALITILFILSGRRLYRDIQPVEDI